MAEKNTIEGIIEQLKEAAKTTSKQQAAIMERYSDLVKKLIDGKLPEKEVRRYVEFLLGEVGRFAQTMTDVNLAYYKALVDAGEQFSVRLEQTAMKSKSAPKPSGAPAARPRARARRGSAKTAARATR